MRLTARRITFGIATAAALALLATLPAFAGSSSKSSTTLVSKVSVTVSSKNEFHFTVKPTSVKKGIVTFTITNSGNLPHDFKVCSSNKGGTANSCNGKATKLINPTTTGKLVVTFLRSGKYEYLCTVSGHAAAGMKGILTVS